MTRTRKPVTASTVKTRESAINTWLEPNIGSLPLREVENPTAKQLIKIMVDGGLSAKSINRYFQLVKSIVSSAVDENGDEIFPRKWNRNSSNSR